MALTDSNSSRRDSSRSVSCLVEVDGDGGSAVSETADKSEEEEAVWKIGPGSDSVEVKDDIGTRTLKLQGETK